MRDALKVTQKVIAAVPERTFEATLLQLEAPRDIAVERPADALPGRGGINVRMQQKLGGDLPGVRDYLERYPFTCFEQQVSTAIGLADRRRWDALMRVLPDYLDRDGLVKYFTLLAEGDDTLTAYVLAVADEAGYRIPDEPRHRMEQALAGFVEGRIVRHSPLPTADLAIRKIAALAALAREQGSGQAVLARQHRDRAQPVADVGGHRLVPAPHPRTGAAEAGRAHAGGLADPALAPEFPGHDDGLLDREERRVVVADGIRRRQRQPAAARASSTRRSGRKTCRGS